jgi:hypothetical protein
MPENLPAEEPLKTYSIEIRDGWVYVLIWNPITMFHSRVLLFLV